MNNLENIARRSEYHALASGIGAASHAEDAGNGADIGLDLRHRLLGSNRIDHDRLAPFPRNFRRIGRRQVLAYVPCHFAFHVFSFSFPLYGIEHRIACLSGSNPDRLRHGQNENFSVAGLSGFICFYYGLNHEIGQLVRNAPG